MILREHQKECIEKIKAHLKTEEKGLVKMFCGSGKSLIIYNCLLTYTNNLSVIVVPSINLITQFNKDYLHNENFKKYNNTLQKQYQTLSVCSRNEIKNDLNFTTDSEKILEFIEEDGIKIILITYQSLPLLIDIIEENDLIIDLIYCLFGCLIFILFLFLFNFSFVHLFLIYFLAIMYLDLKLVLVLIQLLIL